jgi:biopolymer transport protein ExbB/TolQ
LSLALLPCLGLALAAWGIAAWRLYVLAVQAQVDAGSLASALERRIHAGHVTQAQRLCTAMQRTWAADCAQRVLASDDDPGRLTHLIDDLRADYRLQAQWGLGALATLGRMAFPAALGTAIVVMGGAAAQPEIARVEDALGQASASVMLGVIVAVFCRVSASILRRQGDARMREIGTVCRCVVRALTPVSGS